MNPILAAVAHRTREHRIVLGGTALATALELAPGVPMPLLACAGIWLLLGAPATLWYGFAGRVVSTRDGRVLTALSLTVVMDIVAVLLLNTVLPLVGDVHPLARTPLALSSALIVFIIAWSLPVVAQEDRTATESFSRAPGLRATLILGGLSLTLAVAGAVRLNNGLGSTVSVLSLISVALLIGLLLWRRDRYPEGVLELGLFFAAAAVLLLTSLRGWYITGHDIQHEYGVFQLAAEADRWTTDELRDPYNACVSITLLPTAFTRMTGIDGLYVLKVIFPLLFAVTVPMIYRSVRNVARSTVALLSAVYFMIFPSFFTDMPFLARQEIAFLLLGGAMVVLTDRGGRPLRSRRIVFVAMLVGIVLSHYSTAYLVVAVLGLALLIDYICRLLALGRRNRPQPTARGFTAWWMVAAVAGASFLWTGPLTHTGGQFRSTISQTAQDIVDPGNAQSGSSDTAYSLFGGSAVSPEQRLAEYQRETLELTAEHRATRAYIPLNAVKGHPVQAVSVKDLPLTQLGSSLQHAGLNVSASNGFLRQFAAGLFQVLLLLGVVSCLWPRRRPFGPTRDQLILTGAMLVVLGSLTVLPQLSVDYGVLRAFQQGLFFFSPFIAAGSLWVFQWARRWAVLAASTLVMFLFLDLTGVVPQMTGGYPPQLSLNNAGAYYDIYYVRPEERSAITWVKTRTSEDEKEQIQSDVQTDRYTFSRLQTWLRGRALNDIFPTLISMDSYVFLGSTTVRKNETTIFYRGDLVTYRYPMAVLDSTKDKVYSSEGSEIYR